MVKRISLILFVLLLFISMFFTGNPLSKNDYIINIFSIITFVTLIFNKDFKINKTSILFFVIFIISMIPLIFHTYVNLNGTIYYIFRYFNIFIISLLAHNLIKDEKNKDTIIKSIIIGTSLLTIIGIDLCTTGVFKDIVNIVIGNFDINSIGEGRIASTFTYSNALGILISTSLILLTKYIKENNNIYPSIGLLLFIGLLLTGSRSSIIIFGLMMLINIIIDKDNRDLLFKYLLSLFLFGIIALLVVERINTSLIFTSIVAFMIIYELAYKFIYRIKYKINYKKLIMLFIMLIPFVFGLTFFKTPIKAFNNTESYEYNYILNGISKNKNYKVIIDVDTDSNDYIVGIEQRDNKDNEYNIINKTISNFKGCLVFDIETDDNINNLRIHVFNTNKKKANFIINNIKLNGEDKMINYRFIPQSIVKRLNIHSIIKSLSQRTETYLDALKIFKDNLLGIGGDGWYDATSVYKSSSYGISEIHSYPLQVLIEYGIFGIIIYLIIHIHTIKYLNKKELYISLAFVAMFIHSIIDYALAFESLLIIYAILINIVNKDKDINIFRYKYLLLIPVLIALIFNCKELYVKYLISGENKVDKNELVNYRSTYYDIVPYNEKYLSYKAVYYSKNNDDKIFDLADKMLRYYKYSDNNINNIVFLLQFNKLDNMDKYLDNIFKSHKYNLKRMLNDYSVLLTYRNVPIVKNVVKKYYPIDKEYIDDYTNMKINKEDSQTYLVRLEKMYESFYVDANLS